MRNTTRYSYGWNPQRRHHAEQDSTNTGFQAADCGQMARAAGRGRWQQRHDPGDCRGGRIPGTSLPCAHHQRSGRVVEISRRLPSKRLESRPPGRRTLERDRRAERRQRGSPLGGVLRTGLSQQDRHDQQIRRSSTSWRTRDDDHLPAGADCRWHTPHRARRGLHRPRRRGLRKR